GAAAIPRTSMPSPEPVVAKSTAAVRADAGTAKLPIATGSAGGPVIAGTRAASLAEVKPLPAPAVVNGAGTAEASPLFLAARPRRGVAAVHLARRATVGAAS